MKRRTLLVSWMPVVGCSRQNEEGETYLSALKAALRESERIVVTEHSCWMDAYDKDNQKSLVPEPVVYRAVELNAEQRAAFLSTAEHLDPKTQAAFAACIFEPHHTIHFHAKGKLRSELKICFHCNQIEWSETAAKPPQSIYGGLASAIQALGLEPKRDWPALAEAHLKGTAGAHPTSDAAAKELR